MNKFLDQNGLAKVWQNIKTYIDNAVGGGISGGAEDVYSTEEVRIGTWFDGKPLYRIVKTSTIPNKDIEKILATFYEEIQVVSIDGFVRYNPNISPFRDYSLLYMTQYGFFQYVQYNKVGEETYTYIKSSSSAYISSFSGQTVELIITYTKATD